MIRFTIPYPKGKKKAVFCKQYGLNAIYAGKHWADRNEDKAYWHLLVPQLLRQQGVTKRMLDCPVSIAFHWNDGLDLDNHAYMAKLIIDSMKGYLLKDDDKRYVVGVAHRFHEGDFILVEVKP